MEYPDQGFMMMIPTRYPKSMHLDVRRKVRKREDQDRRDATMQAVILEALEKGLPLVK